MDTYYFIYGPSAIITAYSGQSFSSNGETFLELGMPIHEQAGVENQRGYYHHHFTEEQLVFANQVIAEQGLEDIVKIEIKLPKGWRTLSIM